MSLGTDNPPPSFERRLADARPRLVRLARLNGLAADAADDAAQATLITAWQRSANLRQPERFDAWLDGVCRNICLHHRRASTRDAAHALPFSQQDTQQLAAMLDGAAEALAEDDWLAELERADLSMILEQALGYLPPDARRLVEACYLNETPQREVAARLGMTLSALEARLHRARQQLRRALANDLRSSAEAAGIIFADDPPQGWRDTRQWCMFCGQRRMQGIFAPLPDGRLELRMRCPTCCRPGEAYINTGGNVDLRGSRAFGPAFKRLIQTVHGYYTEAIAHGGRNLCHTCGHPIQVAVVPTTSLAYITSATLREHFSMTYWCQRCRAISDAFAFAAIYMLPATQEFIANHPRWIVAPEAACDYQGAPAIRFGLADVTSASRLTILAARDTLQALATFTQ